jgi:uncharacterized protein YcaQ
MLRVAPAAVRRLAIRNQRLAGPLPRGKPTAGHLLETARALRCLQLDPTAVVARSHLLVLFSRHGAFDEAVFEELAYERRELFEYWAHEASYVLSEDLPIHRYEMRTWPRPGGGTWPRMLVEWLAEEKEFHAHVLERLEREGPLRARDIEDLAGRNPLDGHAWAGTRSVGRILEVMWVRGEVGVARRDGAQRLWDRFERCLPPDAPREELSDAQVTRRAAVHAIRALGAARIPHIRAHFTRSRYPGLPEALEALRAGGVVEPLAVEGLGDDWWVLAEDVDALRSDDFRGRTALLSPFDNLLCDRARTEALFGFSHRLEIYTPATKRRWGYFVLPVLDGDRLVARCDLAMDRKAARLKVISVHAEPGLRKGTRLPKAIRRELERLARWRGATAIEIGEAPMAWRPYLG